MPSKTKIDKYKAVSNKETATNAKTQTYAFIFREDVNYSYDIGLPIIDNPSSHIITTSSNTRIPVIYFQYPKATKTLVLSHGNATDMGGMFSVYQAMSTQLKVNVVGYDYTGYGWSKANQVRPTEKQTYKDIESVYQWLITTKRVQDPSRDLLIYGQSVGSGPSTYLALNQPCAGLVLHSPIMSGIRVLTPSRLLCCFGKF